MRWDTDRSVGGNQAAGFALSEGYSDTGYTSASNNDPAPRSLLHRAFWNKSIIENVSWLFASLLLDSVSDTLAYLSGFKRTLLTAACCSCASWIASSQITTWNGLHGTRLVLGMGISANTRVAPILISEIKSICRQLYGTVKWGHLAATILLVSLFAYITLSESKQHLIFRENLLAYAFLLVISTTLENVRRLSASKAHDNALMSISHTRTKCSSDRRYLLTAYNSAAWIARKIQHTCSKQTLYGKTKFSWRWKSTILAVFVIMSAQQLSIAKYVALLFRVECRELICSQYSCLSDDSIWRKVSWPTSRDTEISIEESRITRLSRILICPEWSKFVNFYHHLPNASWPGELDRAPKRF